MTDSDPLLDALHDYYGHHAFRPQQRETIEHVRAGGDALVLMPTGGGKSLCYQLPAILSDGLTVVVSPLIALMHDQVTALQRAGANAQYLNSTLPPMEAAQVERFVAPTARSSCSTSRPSGVNTDRFRNLLEQRNPNLIAIDEAHCISEWGHEFRPDYRVLRRLTERFVDVPTVACTATATPQVQRDIIDQLDRPRMQTFITSFMRDNLTLRIAPKAQGSGSLGRSNTADAGRRRDRLQPVPQEHRRDGGASASARNPGRVLPRRHDRRRPPSRAGPLPQRRDARDLRHHRLRHGHRQARHPASSPTSTCRPRSSPTTRRPAAPDATVSPPSACSSTPRASGTSRCSSSTNSPTRPSANSESTACAR